MTKKNRKTVAVLGSTGSIGRQSLDAASWRGYDVNAIALRRNVSLGEEQIRKYKPTFCAVVDEDAARKLKIAVADTDTKIISGKNSAENMLSEACSDICINGISGFDGLLPTFAAIKYCGRLGLANKESLVAAGKLVMRAASDAGKQIIPVDSEHSAIFRCLTGEKISSVRRLIITCSGGAFFGKKRSELENVTRSEAISHPTWKMGDTITVNCATLMNKGLEVIEASRLFGIPSGRIDVLIHRESIIHSMVEYNDYTVKAQLSIPDMRIPIQYALDYPYCLKSESEPLDFAAIGTLTFSKPDGETFPLLPLAYSVLAADGTLPCVMNAANETAVTAFLRGEIRFTDISDIVIEVTGKSENKTEPSLDDIIYADAQARALALTEIAEAAGKTRR